MADPDDLLSKADALMARHHPERALAAHYAEIPVLEDVVDFAPGSGDLPLLTEYLVHAPPDEEQIKALAASMRESLLAALQPEIDALIDERLKQSLSPLIERMFNELRGELELITHEILSQAIHTAVEQELERKR